MASTRVLADAHLRGMENEGRGSVNSERETDELIHPCAPLKARFDFSGEADTRIDEVVMLDSILEWHDSTLTKAKNQHIRPFCALRFGSTGEPKIVELS